MLKLKQHTINLVTDLAKEFHMTHDEFLEMVLNCWIDDSEIKDDKEGWENEVFNY